MKYTQENTSFMKTKVEVDLQETGFKYIFSDKILFKPTRVEDFFISYADITNQKVYSTRSHPDSRNLAWTLISILIVLIIAVFSLTSSYTGEIHDSTISNIAIYGGIAVVLLIYKILARQKIIIVKGNNGAFFTLLNNKSAENIIKDIIQKRNHYLRKKYIEDNNFKSLTPESVEYFASLEIISHDEASEFKKNIEKNGTGSVGFNTPDVV